MLNKAIQWLSMHVSTLLGFCCVMLLNSFTLLGQNLEEFPLSAYRTHSYTPVDRKPGKFGGEIIYLREHDSCLGLARHMNPDSQTDFQGLIAWVTDALVDGGEFFGFGTTQVDNETLYHIPSPREAIGAISAFNQLCIAHKRRDLCLSVNFYVGASKISDEEYIANLFAETPKAWFNVDAGCDGNQIMQLPLASPKEGSSWYLHDLVFHYVGAILLVPEARFRLNTIARIAKTYHPKRYDRENDDALHELRAKIFGNAIDLLTAHASSIGRLILSEHKTPESIEKAIFARGTRAKKVTLLLSYLGYGDSDADLVLLLGMPGNGLNPITARDASVWTAAWAIEFASKSKQAFHSHTPHVLSSDVLFEQSCVLVSPFIRATITHMGHLTRLINIWKDGRH